MLVENFWKHGDEHYTILLVAKWSNELKHVKRVEGLKARSQPQDPVRAPGRFRSRSALGMGEGRCVMMEWRL
jgi:hypothetical protein